MSEIITDETIEQGRFALYELERQLKLTHVASSDPSSSLPHHSSFQGFSDLDLEINQSDSRSENSKQSERRLLDQLPRVTRLSNRQDSLGLTIEELDDRGLLDGNASVPSYYTSMKQKNRRTLELQPRASRLLEREEGFSKEKNLSKILTSFFHMLKCLVKRGMPLHRYLEQFDKKKNGMLNKKVLFKALTHFLLPFTLKELQDIVQYFHLKNFSSPQSSSSQENDVSLLEEESQDDINYYKFLQDGGIFFESETNTNKDKEERNENSLRVNSKKSNKFKKISGLPEGYDDCDNLLFNNDDENIILFEEEHRETKDKKVNGKISTTNIGSEGKIISEKNLQDHTKIFQKLKYYIIKSMTKLNKDADEIYKSFARWDHLGMGTITTTQFFRVLIRLHINLNDNDQDFLVELLETNTMGRVDFDRILLYCLESNDSSLYYNNNSYNNMLGSNSGNVYYNDDYNNFYSNSPTDNNDETLSAVSIDGNTSSIDLKSNNTINSPQKNSNRLKRPQTASLSRPYTERHDPSLKMFNNSSSTGGTNSIGTGNTTKESPHNNMMSGSLRHLDTLPIINFSEENRKKIEKNRPISALARVSSHEHQKRAYKEKSNSSSRLHRESDIVVNLPDDSEVIYGEEKYLPSSENHRILPKEEDTNNLISNQQNFSPIQDNYYYNNQQNDLFLQQQQFIQQQIQQLQQQHQQLLYMQHHQNHLQHQYQQPNNNYNDGQNYDILSSASLSPTYFPSTTSNLSDERLRQVEYNDQYLLDDKQNNNTHHNNDEEMLNIDNSINKYDDDIEFEIDGNSPSDHLVLLANQILTTIKEILIVKYRKGKSIKELFYFFDRNNKNYFNDLDLIQATNDLNIEISSKVSKIIITILGRDSRSYVTYGEFCVFILDSDHSVLEWTVVEQVAQLLEQQGRDYIDWVIENFLHEYDENYNENYNSNNNNILMNFKDILKNVLLNINKKFVLKNFNYDISLTRNLFSNALKKSGLILTPSELSRLHDRFDLHGNDQCSVLRFIFMIKRSKSWKHSLNVLKHQDQAIKESKIIRDWIYKLNEKVSNSTNASSSSPAAAIALSSTLPPCPHPSLLGILPQLSEELISMCEYLGIGIISEPNMIWIASDALKAPLPVNWTAQKDSQGRTYFYNQLTNQSRWEHPLDPHFRNLRDKYRQSGNDNEETLNEENNNNLPPDGVRRINPSRTDHHHNINNSKARPKVESYIANDLKTNKDNNYNNLREVNKVISNKFRPQSATPEIVMTYKGGDANINKPVKNKVVTSNTSPNRPLSAPLYRSSESNNNTSSIETSMLSKTHNNFISPSDVHSNMNNISHLQPSSSGNTHQLTMNNFNLKSDQTQHTHSFSQSFNLVEQVYSAPFFNNNTTNKPVLLNKQSQPAVLSNTYKSTSNPSSSRGLTPSMSTRPQSAVDRIVSIGKVSGVGGVLNANGSNVMGLLGSTNSPSTNNRKLNPKEKLSDMLQGNIIEKLDNRLIQSLR